MLILGFALLLVGGVLMEAGVTGSSLASVLRGQPDHSKATATSSSSTGTAGTVTPPASSGSPQQAQVTAAAIKIAQAKGWSQQELDAWLQIIDHESGFNPQATNSSTTAAYGLGQFFSPAPGNPILPRAQQLARNFQKYVEYGGNPTTINGQLTGMANYIQRTWGTPQVALSHDLAGSY